MKYDFLTIGGATEDIYMHSDDTLFINTEKYKNVLGLKLGEKALVDGVNFYFGGGAANAAVTFSFMGYKTGAIIRVGDDERGINMIKNLKKKKVDVSLVSIHKEEKSGFSVILFGPGHERAILTYRGANSHLKLGEKELENLKNTEWIYISSLTGEWNKILKQVFKIQGVKIAWNPGSTQLKAGKSALAGYLKKTKILIMNSEEAALLAMTDNTHDHKRKDLVTNIEKLLRLIRSWGPKIVLITEGKDGAHAFDGKKIYFQPTLREKYIMDTIGAGDAFGSGFVAGLKMYNNNFQRALETAAKNAAAEIGKRGPQNRILTSEEIRSRKII